MDNEEINILKQNIQKFKKSAEMVYKTQDFTSATILYFKALFAVLDFIILIDKGKIPKDHSERFRTLEKEYANLYKTLDMLYPLYQNTYRTVINKSNCDEVKQNVERIIKEQGIFENN